MLQHANIARNAFRQLRLVRASKLNSDANIDRAFFGCWLLRFKRLEHWVEFIHNGMNETLLAMRRSLSTTLG